MTRILSFVLIAGTFFALCLIPITAEAQPSFAAYVNYDQPIKTGLSFSKSQLTWLNQVFDLMGSKDFTFVYRLDTNHWMGLYRERLAMVLNIHDGTAKYNFRAQVDRATGAITLLRGVEYKGLGQTAAAKIVATRARDYLQKVLANKDIFMLNSPPVAQNTEPRQPMTATMTDDEDMMPPPASDAGLMTSDIPMVSHAPVAKPMLPARGLGTTPDDSLSLLLAGNSRYVAGASRHLRQDALRREEVAEAQHPLAVVLTCSDSRVPPEILFDQGLGDLFVIRTAGEVVGDYELGSIEYAVEHLHTPYIIVLGHERCGAVDATIQGAEMPDNIARIAQQIRPAVEKARTQQGNLLDNAVRQNARNVLAKIKKSAIVEELRREGKLTLNAAYYDLDTGVVRILE